MLLLKAVKHSKVRLLWIGQAFSAMGDEIYRVAFVWLCVQMIGSETGYLSSLQLVAALCANIFGIRLVDHLHSEEAMVRLDSYRAVIVMIPVGLYFLHIPSFVTLVICALLLSGLGALFDPVVMETVPKVASDVILLKAANGLMSTTLRLARVVGPMVVGFLSGLIPIIHFFTIDALTFVFSAYSIKAIKIKKMPSKVVPPFKWTTFKDTLIESIVLLRSQPPVFRTLMAKCFAGGAWGLAFLLGLALLANEISPNKLVVFGSMISCYGIGNIAGVILIGNLHRHNPEKMIYHGLIWLGFFFAFVPIVSSFPILLVLLALTAIGGPWNDLPFADLVQAHYPTHAISKIYRLRNILDTVTQLIMMLASPLLFHIFSVRGVIFGCGVMMALGGILGEWARKSSLKGFT